MQILVRVHSSLFRYIQAYKKFLFLVPRVEVPGDKIETQILKSAIPHPITIQNMRFEKKLVNNPFKWMGDWVIGWVDGSAGRVCIEHLTMLMIYVDMDVFPKSR